mmetsp:Transcript_18138/g.39948  ORF Transcript_18138/g.39948 Transcript_18138/m.39948 type:complete len:86 (+) Transcript_18138:119-376(+)
MRLSQLWLRNLIWEQHLLVEAAPRILCPKKKRYRNSRSDFMAVLDGWNPMGVICIPGFVEIHSVPTVKPTSLTTPCTLIAAWFDR